MLQNMFRGKQGFGEQSCLVFIPTAIPHYMLKARYQNHLLQRPTCKSKEEHGDTSLCIHDVNGGAGKAYEISLGTTQIDDCLIL